MMFFPGFRLGLFPVLVVLSQGVAQARSETDVTAKPVVAVASATPADPKAYLLIDAPSVAKFPASFVGIGSGMSSAAIRVGSSAGRDAGLDSTSADAQSEGFKPPRAERRLAKQEEEAQRNTDCEDHFLQGKPCRVSWVRVISESFMFLAAQHGGNIYMDDDTRTNLRTRPFWSTYIDCVDNYRFSRWKDDDPIGVDYVGHPMMGALTNSIYEQNDPKQRALRYENSKRYWYGRLRATAYSAFYSTQWKLGPASEASIGNTGVGYYVRDRDGIITNETGMQDFFVTPIGGLAWNVGEDALDKYIVSHIRHAHPRNMPLLIVAGIITPLKSAANMLRFRAFYYRDYDNSTTSNRTR